MPRPYLTGNANMTAEFVMAEMDRIETKYKSDVAKIEQAILAAEQEATAKERERSAKMMEEKHYFGLATLIREEPK